MLACALCGDITPSGPVCLGGVAGAHQSNDVHDPIHARALALADSARPEDAFVLAALDVNVIPTDYADAVRRLAAERTGIPVDRIILAATHTHSAPALYPAPDQNSSQYLAMLKARVVDLVERVFRGLAPAQAGWGYGSEDTISHYRRLMTDDGNVVTRSAGLPAESIIGPLGKVDPEVIALQVVAAGPRRKTLAVLFNHAGHPDMFARRRGLISADYPGVCAAVLGKHFGGSAVFLNGAQGSVDIDPERDHDEQGSQRAGEALAAAVVKALADTRHAALKISGGAVKYDLPARKITAAEYEWAVKALEHAAKNEGTGAQDDAEAGKARLYHELRETEGTPFSIGQVGVAVGDCAILTFPGELFAEIGMRIKSESPFKHTMIVGLANGYIGYLPTAKAVLEGGFEPERRRTDAAAEETVVAKSLQLLREMHAGGCHG